MKYVLPRLLESLRERRSREWWELSPAGFYLQYRVLAPALRLAGINRLYRTWLGRLLYAPRPDVDSTRERISRHQRFNGGTQ